MKIIIDGLAVNYQASGQGKLVLLLHGWGDDSRTFSHLTANLSKDFRVVTLDLPGFGSSQTPREVWDLDNYASFLAAFLNKLNFGQPYAIIGHSNGGALAIRALGLGKLSAQKLILLAASGIRDTGGLKRRVTKVVAKTGKVVTFPLPYKQRQKLRRKLYGTIGSDLLLAPHLQETFKCTVRQDVQVDAAKISVPALLVYADNDPAIPIGDAKRYHELMGNSRLEILPSSDHFIHHSNASQVEELIKGFL